MEPKRQWPEILAPAGGPQAFFAALNAGADAVYLGLPGHNARARAINFSFEDLAVLIPLARHHGMKVLVTLNVVMKSAEMDGLCETLARLEPLGAHALIVQDLGLGRFIQKAFPGFRLHASTQMAVHNLAGVLAAYEAGFRRVVLARELTHPELRRIRAGAPGVELEAFCHGSLCYAYSGLCLFAGAKDARSGNRGECTYACREPWRIESEPGHGFLFSMKDLDTSAEVPRWVELGIDALKIEGRKKDAQYVAAAVGLYRQALNTALGKNTMRPQAPPSALSALAASLYKERGFTFQRAPTTFHFVGRYAENVIDLDEPSHKGVVAGEVLAVAGARFTVKTAVPLSRHDGLRVEPPGPLYHSTPQHGGAPTGAMDDLEDRYQAGGLRMAVGDMWVNGRPSFECGAGDTAELLVPPGQTPVRVGHVLWKTRSDALRQQVEPLTHPPPDARLRQLDPVTVTVTLGEGVSGQLPLRVQVEGLTGLLADVEGSLADEKPRVSQNLVADLNEVFSIFGETGHGATEIKIFGPQGVFVPRSRLKAIKKELVAQIPGGVARLQGLAVARAQGILLAPNHPAQITTEQTPLIFSVKCDRPSTLEALASWPTWSPHQGLGEIVFEPKRMFLKRENAEGFIENFLARCRDLGALPRMALPTVIRNWDEIFAKKWALSFFEQGGRHFEVGNIGAFQLLKDWGLWGKVEIATDHYLYALHSQAARFYSEAGASVVTLAVEQDAADAEHLMARWPWDGAQPQAILFKDVPLFLAEACTLTALHHGCPGSKVCGYRTLDIVSRTGEKFQVAHEECKSVVYGRDAWYVGDLRSRHEAWGIKRFRLDFLTRDYPADRVEEVVRSAVGMGPVSGTHRAHFLGRLA